MCENKKAEQGCVIAKRSVNLFKPAHHAGHFVGDLGWHLDGVLLHQRSPFGPDGGLRRETRHALVVVGRTQPAKFSGFSCGEEWGNSSKTPVKNFNSLLVGKYMGLWMKNTCQILMK